MTSTTQEEKRGWKQDPAAVQRDILAVATSEFAMNGFSGTRVDSIAASTRTSKRMIYYYFGDKLGLYTSVLEAAYRTVREGETTLELDHLLPLEALARLVAFTFDHHRNHPEFIRLVMIENIHHAEALQTSRSIREMNTAAIDKLRALCQRGEAEGAFRPGLDPIALHWQISAASFFNVSNRPTFSALFGTALFDDAAQDRLRAQTVEAILALVRA